MNQAILQVIRNEIEKIEQSSGHGVVTILIKNGEGYQIKAEQSILLAGVCKETLDKPDVK